MVIIIIAVVLGILGVIGSVAPALPGPPLSWIALLILYLMPLDDPVSLTTLLIWLGITTVVTVVDYILPASMTRTMGGHKAASAGAAIGLFVGLFIPPAGMILGSLLGAFLAEFFIENGGVMSSFKASLGAFLGFIVTTGLKLVASAIMLWVIIAHLL